MPSLRSNSIRYAPDGEQPGLEGAVSLIEHGGRRAWLAGSVHDRICFPRHTLNAPCGTLTLRLLPLEDFSTCVQIPHTQEREPGAWSTVLLSDHRDLRARQAGWPAVPPGAFALVYSRDWYQQLYAKFYQGNIYMDAYEPGRHKAIVTLGHLNLPRLRWVQLTLTWDRAASDYRLYIEGVLVQRSSEYGPLVHEPCGSALYAGDPAIALGELVFDDAVSPPAPLGGKDDLFARSLLSHHAVTALPPFSAPDDRTHWRAVCSRSLAGEDDRKLFHVQGMQDVLKTTPEGLEVRTSSVHPLQLPRPTDWPEDEPCDVGQTYLWLDRLCDGDLWLEFDFMPLQRHGLALLMLQAQGMHREDFMLDHPRRRTGAMRMVCWENVRNYHWEYYRQMEDCRHDRASHVLVKNPVLHPLAYQVMPGLLEVGRWHRLAFVQEGGRLRGSIDGQLIFDVVDSPLAGFGPVYDRGRIAFRCMFDTWMRMRVLGSHAEFRSTMQYRTLGNTGLRVSILGLGTAPFGGVYGAVDEKECKACLDRALDLGINFIDSAPSYGNTQAESVLGNCLRGVPRDRYILATKVGCYGSSPLEFDFSAKRVAKSIDESLERLGIDHIDLIQCHDIEAADLDQIVNETLPALRECVRRGKARYVGITGLPLRIFRYVTARTDVDTILSYCHYTLCDQSLLDLVPMLEARKIGIINAAPLCMGLLTFDGPPARHPAPPPLRSACRRAAERCRAMGVDLPRLALHFSLARPEIHTTLVGAASAEVISQNAAWIDAPIDEALNAEVREILAPVQRVTWGTGREENR